MTHRARYFIPLALLAAGLSDLQSQTDRKSAESLLKEMAAVYAAAQSYSDSSVAHYRNLDGSERLTVDFKIWFLRPSSFRVDAESKRSEGAAPRREVLWADAAAVRTWATGKAVTTRPKVQLAGSGMFGTYAYHIPTLLQPSYGGHRRLHELSTPTLAGEEVFEGVDCHRIKGLWQSGTYEVWLGKTDHLVRKVVATHTDHQVEEIHREIAINQPIPPEVFRFAPENEAVSPPATSPSPKKKK